MHLPAILCRQDRTCDAQMLFPQDWAMEDGKHVRPALVDVHVVLAAQGSLRLTTLFDCAAAGRRGCSWSTRSSAKQVAVVTLSLNLL